MTVSAFKLEDVGFTREQVEALMEHTAASVATKADIVEIKGELRLAHWMVGLAIAIGLTNLYLILRLLQTT